MALDLTRTRSRRSEGGVMSPYFPLFITPMGRSALRMVAFELDWMPFGLGLGL